MRSRFEFTFYRHSAVTAGADEGLNLLGSLGWEMRGIAIAADGSLIVGLQRVAGEEPLLPDAPTLAAALEEPLKTTTLLEAEPGA